MGKEQLSIPIWVVVPCTALGVGLGYFYASFHRSKRRSTDVVRTTTPHPDWIPGRKQLPPGGIDTGHVQLDPTKLKSCYHLVISAVVPRPIALVSTQAKDGTVNLAPFSYFNVVGHDPPVLVFSVCRYGDGGKKDTMVNLEDTGECVVSIMSEWFVEAANHTCGKFLPEVDEMAVAGLTPAPSVLVNPPRVRESAMNMECKVRQTFDIVNHSGVVTTTVIFGEVVMFHALPGLLDEAGAGEGKPTMHIEGYKPMARLGGNTYAQLGSVFDLRRPKVP